MATWNSAVIIDAGKRDGYFYCTIQYSDDTGRVIVKSYTAQNISNAYIESVAQSEIAGFTAADQAVSNTTYRKGSSINLVPPTITIVQPSASDNWLSLYRQWRQTQLAVDQGLGIAAQADADSLKSQVVSGALQSYISLLPIK